MPTLIRKFGFAPRWLRGSCCGATWRRTTSVGFLLVCVATCTTYRDNLSRAERLYQENKFEDSLALCRLMERDMDALSRSEQARYAFLRGMTDYRLGYRTDARHWLAVANAIHEQEAGGLDADAQATTERTLDELNREVYGLLPVDTETTTKEHTDEEAGDSEAGDSEAAETATESSAGSQSVDSEPESFCRVDADCDGALICVADRCTAP